MLSWLNALKLVHTLTRHCYRWFASYKWPFRCYSSVSPFIPLSSFVWTSKGIWKVLFGRVSLFVPRDSRPITFIIGRHFRQMIATFLSHVGHMCVLSLCFPRIDFVSFLSKETPHIFLLLHYTLHLKSETKRNLLHPSYSKTPFPLDSINGWFCFH